MGNPKFLMLDEPSLGIAPRLISTIFEKIVEINQNHGITILLSSRTPTSPSQVSQQAYVLETGAIRHVRREQKTSRRPAAQSHLPRRVEVGRVVPDLPAACDCAFQLPAVRLRPSAPLRCRLFRRLQPRHSPTRTPRFDSAFRPHRPRPHPLPFSRRRARPRTSPGPRSPAKTNRRTRWWRPGSGVEQSAASTRQLEQSRRRRPRRRRGDHAQYSRREGLRSTATSTLPLRRSGSRCSNAPRAKPSASASASTWPPAPAGPSAAPRVDPRRRRAPGRPRLAPAAASSAEAHRTTASSAPRPAPRRLRPRSLLPRRPPAATSRRIRPGSSAANKPPRPHPRPVPATPPRDDYGASLATRAAPRGLPRDPRLRYPGLRRRPPRQARRRRPRQRFPPTPSAA